jgi:hypothetical protein
MAGLHKCYITQINYLSENGLLGMEYLDESEKVYIFYKHEDNIPVTLHIGIQKNVNAQIEYIEAENDAEKYLMLGLIVGRNDKNVEYVTVDPQLELPEVFLQMAGDVKKKDRFSDVPKQKKLQDVSVKKENALREKMPEKHQKMKDADKISEKKDVISEQQEGQENTASDPTDFKKDQSVINREYDEMIKNKTLEEDYMDVLEYLGLKKEMLTGEFPERIIAQNIVNIYSDNTDSEKIRKALENVFGQKDTAVIMGKVATKKANLVIRAKEITRKLNHNEY